MPKVAKPASLPGAVSAAQDVIEEGTSKIARAHDVIKSHVAEQESTIAELTAQLEQQKAAAERELAATKESLARQVEEWKGKALIAERKVERSFAELSR